MKINSIRISNVLSFESHDNIDDCDEFKIDDAINILIGPNGAGKSNFIDIMNQLFKRILILNYELDEENIKRCRQEPYGNDLRHTLKMRRIRHELKKNYQSITDKIEIKLELMLGEDDLRNLKFLFNNLEKIQNLFYYTWEPPQFVKKGISENELVSMKYITLHLTEENTSTFFINKNDLSKVELFILNYVNYFQLLNYVIYLGIHYHNEKWSLLNNTFALLGEIRNYSACLLYTSPSPRDS